MSSALPIIKFLKDIGKKDTLSVGGKGANLGEMASAGFPVPDGFCVTAHAYDLFLEKNMIADKVYEILKVLDVAKPEELQQASTKIKRIVKSGDVPDEVKREIISSYRKLSRISHSLVAVRSSATAEDAPGTSFAGQQETFLNIKGEANLIESVRGCWASLFTPRSIFYRVENKIAHETVKVAVVVQKMVQSEVSGVMFSIDPVKNLKDRIIIESVWGLGEMIVQGSVIPDRYIVQKETFSILSKEISEQRVQLVRSGSENVEREVSKNCIDKQKITDEDIITLAKYSDKLQKHYYFPQDSEWAKEKGKLYIVQTRPVTTIKSTANINRKNKKDNVKMSDSPILTGVPASPGMGTGSVKILKSAKEIGKVSHGDILIAPMTSPDYVPAMKKAEAIVTDEGGQTSHAAIVSRELGIPCIVGTKEATKILKEGEIVTVDGTTGNIYFGSRIKDVKPQVTEEEERKILTATKIYVNLAEPSRAKEIAAKDVDGVGLLRAEFMMAELGTHPKDVIKRMKQEKFVEKLADGISQFCAAFGNRPVVYRATDFKTNEYRMLEGGKSWEPVESNPMLGFRGAFRYIAWPEVFALELKALKKVQEKHKNIRLMIPFVRSPQELVRIRRIVSAEGLFDTPTFKFWMMVEVPINVILIEDFIRVGIDGVSIGSNDLTMLITGTDRDNSEVAQAFDERSPAVLWALRKTIKTCNKFGITSSICGQAPSLYEDLVEKLITWGITSISVNPDVIYRVRRVVHDVEKRITNKE